MKTRLSSALLAGIGLLAGCQSNSITPENNPPAGAAAGFNAATAATDSGSVSYGVELDLPISLSAYQPVTLQAVAASDTSYAALVPCPRDTAGALSVLFQVKPQQHSIEKLTLLYAGTTANRTLKQLGSGVGHYDPKTRRYIFTVDYQATTELPGNMRRFSELYEINGWVSTESNTAGVQPIQIAE